MSQPPANADPSVLRMAAPLVVSFWMRAAFTFVDTIYAATIGDAAIAGIGLIVPLEFVMIALWVGMSTGLTSVLSRAMAAREGRKIERYLRCAWRLVLAATPPFALLGAAVWFLAPHMGLEPDVQRSLQIYGTTLIFGAAFTTFWSVIPDSVVKAHQDTRSTMWAGIWSNTINLVLNTVFLFVFHWGMFGIALSTVLGRIGGLVYALVKAKGHEDRRKAEDPGDVTTEDPSPYRSILSLAIPSSLSFFLMATETAIINRLLSKLPHSTEAIAAYSIYYRVILFFLNPVIAGSVALLPYTSRRFGRGDLAGIRRGVRQVLTASTVYAILVVGPIMLFGGAWIAGALAETPVTARYTEFALWTVPLAVLLGAPFLLVRPTFEGMQRGKPGLVISLIRYLVFTGPLAYAGILVAESMGQPGLYGVVVGLLLVAALMSLGFWLWLRAALTQPSVTPASP